MKTALDLFISSTRGCLAPRPCLLDDFRKERENNVCVQAREMCAEGSNVCISSEIFVCL